MSPLDHITSNFSQLPEDTRQDIVGRIVTYGLGVPVVANGAMGWLGENASAINALCVIVGTVVLVVRLVYDLRRKK
jgi:hypothetical protein